MEDNKSVKSIIKWCTVDVRFVQSIKSILRLSNKCRRLSLSTFNDDVVYDEDEYERSIKSGKEIRWSRKLAKCLRLHRTRMLRRKRNKNRENHSREQFPDKHPFLVVSCLLASLHFSFLDFCFKFSHEKRFFSCSLKFDVERLQPTWKLCSDDESSTLPDAAICCPSFRWKLFYE